MQEAPRINYPSPLDSAAECVSAYALACHVTAGAPFRRAKRRRPGVFLSPPEIQDAL